MEEFSDSANRFILELDHIEWFDECAKCEIRLTVTDPQRISSDLIGGQQQKERANKFWETSI